MTSPITPEDSSTPREVLPSSDQDIAPALLPAAILGSDAEALQAARDLAYRYGYQRFEAQVMLTVIVVLVAMVSLIQLGGDRLAGAEQARGAASSTEASHGSGLFWRCRLQVKSGLCPSAWSPDPVIICALLALRPIAHP